MEPNDLWQVICFSLPILLLIGIVVVVILIIVAVKFILRTRNKVKIAQLTGNTIRKGLGEFDQYVQNDHRQTSSWQSQSPTKEPVLDLDDIKVDSSKKAPTQIDPLPDWDADSLVCPACGAPHQEDNRVCTFCGHTFHHA